MADESPVAQTRKPEYSVSEIFINRWSRRSMTGEEITETELMSLFEAAKWAPSSYNSQPWRYLYANRSSGDFNLFLGLLVELNQSWAKEASTLIVMLSKKTHEQSGQPAQTHSFDAGAAWENLALQGSLMGLVVHAMQGFDYDKARELLEIPDDYQVEAMVAVGRPGKVEDLPEPLRKREQPSGRKAVSQLAFEGKFPTWA